MSKSIAIIAFSMLLIQFGCVGGESVEGDLGQIESSLAQCNQMLLPGGSGDICADFDPQGYQARAVFDITRNDWMDFNLRCDSGRWFGDNGAFQTPHTGSYTYVFRVGSQGRCHVTIFDRSAGGEASSPSVTR